MHAMTPRVANMIRTLQVTVEAYTLIVLSSSQLLYTNSFPPPHHHGHSVANPARMRCPSTRRYVTSSDAMAFHSDRVLHPVHSTTTAMSIAATSDMARKPKVIAPICMSESVRQRGLSMNRKSPGARHSETGRHTMDITSNGLVTMAQQWCMGTQCHESHHPSLRPLRHKSAIPRVMRRARHTVTTTNAAESVAGMSMRSHQRYTAAVRRRFWWSCCRLLQSCAISFPHKWQ